MLKKIEINSEFLKSNLINAESIHFLSDKPYFYIRTDKIEEFYDDSDISFWAELEETEWATIIVLYFKINNSESEELYEFYYDTNEEADYEELLWLTENGVIDINIMKIEGENLYFGYKYELKIDRLFKDKLNIMLKLAENHTSGLKFYDFEKALDLFLDGKSEFKFKTSSVNDYNIQPPRFQESEEEKKFFTYTSKTGGNSYDDGDALKIKVYKREDYEKLKKKNNTENKEKTKKEYIEDIKILKDKINELENIISTQKREIEKLKAENENLKEELEYKKLDISKKSWKLF